MSRPPQLELGRDFTRVPNALLERAAGPGLTGEERRVLLALLRLLPGWNRLAGHVSSSKVAEIASMRPKRAHAVLQRLARRGIIDRSARPGARRGAHVALRHPDLWIAEAHRPSPSRGEVESPNTLPRVGEGPSPSEGSPTFPPQGGDHRKGDTGSIEATRGRGMRLAAELRERLATELDLTAEDARRRLASIIEHLELVHGGEPPPEALREAVEAELGTGQPAQPAREPRPVRPEAERAGAATGGRGW